MLNGFQLTVKYSFHKQDKKKIQTKTQIKKLKLKVTILIKNKNICKF